MTRTALLLGTALSLAGAPTWRHVASAQPAPGQLPTGMTVVAGSAKGGVAGGTLTVTQGSARAAIDWRSFDVGSAARVRFIDPSSQSVTLNRVTGPAGTTIAGHVTSNGQLVIVNQSGVVVTPSGAIDAQSVVLSAAGISQQGMRQGVASGHFLLDQAARPGAQVANQGRISVRQAGLAALVAPQVANSGTISAPFGTVKLAGETAQVVDLYGDGLLSVDVTKQTAQVSGADGRRQAALVTNDGVILAQGGRVTLSTDAVEGVVSNLVTAGGTISTDGARGGRIAIDAQGGSAVVTGQILARGRHGVGGQIELLASRDVTLAQGTRADVSGTAGGGAIAVGTTIARAARGPGINAPKARHVLVEQGATLAADATVSGRGGHVTLLSSDSTVFAGAITARGGSTAGDGGFVEVSGDRGLALLGHVDASSPHGAGGTLLLDPTNLTIDASGAITVAPGGTAAVPGSVTNATITGASLAAFDGGDILLQATGALVVQDKIALTGGHALDLTGGTITIAAGQSVTNNGQIRLQATTGSVEVAGLVQSTGAGVNPTDPSAGIVTVIGPAAITVDRGGTLQGQIVQVLGGTGAITGSLTIATGGAIVAPKGLALTVAGAKENAGGVIQTGGLLFGSGTSGPIDFSVGNNAIQSIGALSLSGAGAAILVTTAGSLAVSGALSASTITLQADTLGIGANVTATTALTLTGGSVTQTGGTISTPLLNGRSTAGNFEVGDAGNAIGTASGISATGGNLLIRDDQALTIAGRLAVGAGQTISLIALALLQQNVDAGIVARGGVVEIAPNTAADVTIGGAKPSSTALVLDKALLASITADTLRIGGAAGSVTATNVALAPGAIDLTRFATLELDGTALATAGTLSAQTFLVGSAGNNANLSALVLTAATAGGNGVLGGLTLDNAGNAIAALGATTINGGSLLLATTSTLDVTGAVSLNGTGVVSLNAGGQIRFDAALTAAQGTLAVTTSNGGNLTQTAAINAHRVSGNVAGIFDLGDPTNAIDQLGDISAQQVVRVYSSHSLDVEGTLKPSPVEGGTTIDLGAPTLTETGGVLSATTLTSGTGIGAGGATLLGANTIDTISTIISTGTLAVRTTGDLLVGREIGATNATLEAGGTITFDTAQPLALGTLGTLDLQANGFVVQNFNGGLISTSALGVLAIAPNVGEALTVGAAGGAGTAGIDPAFFASVNTATLQLGGLEIGGPVATSISFANTTSGLGGAQTLKVLSLGDVTQSSAISVASLGGTVDGRLLLGNTGNIIRALSGLTLSGDSQLSSSAVDVTGTVSLAAGRTLSLATSRFAISTGTIAAAGGTVEIGPQFDSVVFWGGFRNAIQANLDAITAGVLRLGRSAAGGIATNLELIAADSARGAATLELDAGGLVNEFSTASLALAATGVLTANAGSGVVLVGDSANAIAHVGRVTAPSITIDSGESLQVVGQVSASTGAVVLSAPTIDVAVGSGVTSAVGDVQFAADRFVNEGALSAVGHAVAITRRSPTGTLTIGAAGFGTGSVNAAEVRLGSLDGVTGFVDDIRFESAFDVGSITLGLFSKGAVSQAAGAIITAGALTGSASSVALDTATNAIGVLGNFTVGSGQSFALRTGAALFVDGIVTAPLGLITLRAPSVDVAAAANITARTLALLPGIDGGTLGAAVEVGAALSVSTLDVGVLAGTTLASSVSLGTLAFSGPLLDLAAGGDITQSGALILGSTTTLDAGAGGNVALGNAGNQVSLLGQISASGTVALADQTAATLAGRVSAPVVRLLIAGLDQAAGGSIDAGVAGLVEVAPLGGGLLGLGDGAGGARVSSAALAAIRAGTLRLGADGGTFGVTASSVSIAGQVAPNSATIDLQSGGAIDEILAGAIVLPGGTVTGDAGSVGLTGANTIGTLGHLAAGGNVAVFDNVGLVVASDVRNGSTATVSGANVILSVGGLLGIDGRIAATNAIDLTAQGATESATGVLQAAVLQSSGTPTGVFALTQTNTIDSLGAWNGPAASLSLTSGRTLSVAGVSVAALTLKAPSLLLTGDVTAGSADVTTTSGGLIQTGGTLSATTLAALIATSATLGSAGNVIGTLEDVTVGTDLRLQDQGALAIAGVVTAPGVFDLSSAGASETGRIVAGTLASTGAPAASGVLDLVGANTIGTLGTFTAPAASLVLRDGRQLIVAGTVGLANLDLTIGAGGVSETVGGRLDISGSLTSAGNIAGGATLDQANAIAALGNLAVTGGNLSLVDGTFTVTGTVSAPNIQFVSSGSLTLTGALLTQGTADLTAVGVGEATTGTISAATLDSTGAPAGLYALTGANTIGSLGVFQTTGGTLQLTDGVALTVAGAVAAPTLILSAPGITFAGNVAVGSLDVTSSGNVGQTAGAIAAGVLASTGGVAGTLDLRDGGNNIASLGSIAAGQAILLSTSGDLAIAGAVSAAALAQFNVGGTLSETTGTLATGRLQGSAGAIALGAAGNAIASLGNVAASGGLSLTDGQALILAGTLSAASTTLVSTSAIDEVGGVIATGALSLQAASAGLGGANRIVTLGNTTIPGALTLVNASALQLAGAIDPSTFDLTLLTGDAIQVAGEITAAQFTSSGGIAGNLILQSAANQIGAIGGMRSGGAMVIADAQSLLINGDLAAPVLDISDAQSVTQTAGAISGALLSRGGIAGDALLLQAGNQIGSIGNIAVGGTLAVATGGPLLVEGPLSAANATLDSGGAMTLAGAIGVPGTLSLNAGGTITRTQGALDVGTLTGRAVSTADFGTGAGVQTLGGFTVLDGGDVPGGASFSRLRLFDGTSLRVSGPVAADYIRVDASGTLTLTGTIVTLGTPRLLNELPVPNTDGTTFSVSNPGGVINQVGTLSIVPQDGAIATVRLQLGGNGGSITLENLVGPNTDLLLFTGTGTATGHINVGDLLVSGRAGGTQLFGSVRGLLGAAAASTSDILPLQDANYRLNSCPIQSINCILLPTAGLPPSNPLRDFAVGQARDDQDDADILLPNVSDRDY